MPAHILVVDDDPDTLKLVCLILEDHGFLVGPAGNGEQALAVLQEDAPDLVLLDQWMPGMDGLELARRIRAVPGLKQLPIVLFSARDELDSQDGAGAGITATLSKLTRPAELVAILRSLLAGQ